MDLENDDDADFTGDERAEDREEEDGVRLRVCTRLMEGD